MIGLFLIAAIAFGLNVPGGAEAQIQLYDVIRDWSNSTTRGADCSAALGVL